MASDVVALLRASKAWVDPNLVQLINGSPNTSATNRADGAGKRQKQAEDQIPSNRDECEAQKPLNSDDASDDDGQFRHLNPKSIALKRASHVSVASDSSDDDDE
jgi:hypothetical protein